jgi:hypothetical protein
VKRAVHWIIVSSCLLIALASVHWTPQAVAESKSVKFEQDFDLFTVNFSASMNIPDGSLPPNGTTTFTPSTSAGKMTINVTIPSYSPVSMQVDPIGQNNYTIPGLVYTIPGVGNISLALMLKGTINGDLSAVGNGTLNMDSLEWTDYGGRDVVLNATSEAKEGELVNVTLSDVEYSVYAGIKAEGDIGGQHYEFIIIERAKLGSISGNPSSVTGTFRVEYPFPFGIVLWAVAGVLGIASIAIAALYMKSKGELDKLQKKATTPASTAPAQPAPSGKVCASCGTPNAPQAKFCKKCGKKL